MTATAHHVGAVPIETVVCPSRCTTSQAEHLADLPGWDGFVIHWSAKVEGEGWSVWHSSLTYSDGTPVEGPDGLQVHVGPIYEGLQPDESLRFANALREAAIWRGCDE